MQDVDKRCLQDNISRPCHLHFTPYFQLLQKTTAVSYPQQLTPSNSSNRRVVDREKYATLRYQSCTLVSSLSCQIYISGRKRKQKNRTPYHVFWYQSMLRDIQHQLRVLEVFNLDLNRKTISSMAGMPEFQNTMKGLNLNATGHRPLPKLSPTNASTCIDRQYPSFDARSEPIKRLTSFRSCAERQATNGRVMQCIRHQQEQITFLTTLGMAEWQTFVPQIAPYMISRRRVLPKYSVLARVTSCAGGVTTG